MNGELTWKIGGEQGEGIDGAGEIISWTLSRLGYYVYAYRHFMSLIKGGHTHYKIRAGAQMLRHFGDQTDILVAFDQYSVEYNSNDMAPGSFIVYDATAFTARLPEGCQGELLAVPMGRIAEEHGGKIMKNTVALGVTAALVGLRPEDLEGPIADRFGGKQGDVVDKNMAALRAGHEFGQQHFGQRRVLPIRLPGAARLLMTGNEAVALGAIMGGCRLNAAYPITPATEILYTLLRFFPKVGGAVVQAEDEIAALNMAMGANFSGVRAMTSTSGPGFSLMTEALGMAGIAEIPVVIVDVMRAGPSTGLPTKTEQGDLNQALFSSHGEMPRIVLAPSTVEECFYYTAEAFNLAEIYQCPVIILTDLMLGMSKHSIEGLDYDRVQIVRGKLLSQAELDAMGRGAYRRYLLTEDGISPRTIPGQKNGRWVALSNEHDEEATREIEDQTMRVLQMNKRMKKLQRLDFSAGDWVTYAGPEQPELLLVGWGSTRGVLEEVLPKLQEQGHAVGHLHLTALWPFPDGKVREHLARARRIVVVENNFTGQLANLIRMRLGFHDKMSVVHKFNGDPFRTSDILDGLKEVFAGGHVS